MRTRALGGLVLGSILLAGCPDPKVVPPPPPPPPPSQMAYCDEVLSGIYSNHQPGQEHPFKCADPPNGSRAGTYGPIARPWSNDLAVSCFSENVPSGLTVTRAPALNKSWSRREERVLDAGAGIDFSKILPFIPAKWLPSTTFNLSKQRRLSYKVSFSDAEITTYTDVPRSIRMAVDRAAGAQGTETMRADVKACVRNLCEGEYVIASRAFTAKVSIELSGASKGATAAEIGWSQLGAGGHLRTTDNADGSLTITSDEPVVIAVEALDPAAVKQDLGGQGVCASGAAHASLTNAVEKLALSFIEGYQCSVLYVGNELANSICPGGQAPVCNGSASVTPVTEGTSGACSPLTLQRAVYSCRMNSFDTSTLSLGCSAFEKEVNVGIAADPSPVSLRCAQTGSTFLHDHGAERQRDVLRKPHLQVQMAREFLSRSTGPEIDTILHAWDQRYGHTHHDQARAAWQSASQAYNWVTWPLGEGRQDWQTFEQRTFAAALDYLSRESNVVAVSGYNPGCPSLAMEWDATQRQWRVVRTSSAANGIRVDFGAAAGTNEMAKRFAQELTKSQ